MTKPLARELLEDGRCTPNCLLAGKEDDCECRCKGEYHSLLIDLTGTPDQYILRRGDVVALGLRGGDCPVGHVDLVTDWGVRLQLMSFLTGFFDQGGLGIRWEDIQRVVYADPETDPDEVAFSLGLTGSTKAKVFNIRPLGRFQTNWKKGHERGGE